MLRNKHTTIFRGMCYTVQGLDKMLINALHKIDTDTVNFPYLMLHLEQHL